MVNENNKLEDKKPFLKLPAKVRYELLSKWSVTSLQDMRNQERRKANVESDETIVYFRKEGNETYETRVSTYTIEANCWHGSWKCENKPLASNNMTEEYLFTMLKHDQGGKFRLGFSNYLASCEAAAKSYISKKYIEDQEKIKEKYLELREKYLDDEEE